MRGSERENEREKRRKRRERVGAREREEGKKVVNLWSLQGQSYSAQLLNCVHSS